MTFSLAAILNYECDKNKYLNGRSYEVVGICLSGILLLIEAINLFSFQ